MINTKDKQSILFVIGDMERGGAQRVISVLANYYASHGVNVSIAILLNNINSYELNPNIKIINLGVKRGNYILKAPKLIYRLRKLIKKSKFDEIISFVGRVNIITILSNFGLHNPLVVSERNDPQYDNRNRFEKYLCKKLYKQAKKVVFQTNYQKKWFGNNCKKNGVIIQNPVAISPFYGNHISNDIIAVGKLMDQKNYELLIESFLKIKDKMSQNLHIYGDGIKKESLLNIINTNNANDRIYIHSNTPKIEEVMKNNKFYIITSNYEGMSNSLLEAMTTGMICITTNWNGVDEIINNNYDGFIVKKNDVNELSKTFLQVLNMKNDKLNKISKNAVESSKKYNVDNIIKEWNKVIIIKKDD